MYCTIIAPLCPFGKAPQGGKHPVHRCGRPAIAFERAEIAFPFSLCCYSLFLTIVLYVDRKLCCLLIYKRIGGRGDFVVGCWLLLFFFSCV